MYQNICSHFAAAGTAALLAVSPDVVFAQTVEERRERGAAVIRSLNNGMTQPNLEAMRQEFPFLAEATEAYALGDVWSRPGLDNRTRQLAAVAAFAAMGLTDLMKVHAGYALNIGVPKEELKEVIYMITVPAGFPVPLLRRKHCLSFLRSGRKPATISQREPGRSHGLEAGNRRSCRRSSPALRPRGEYCSTSFADAAQNTRPPTWRPNKNRLDCS